MAGAASVLGALAVAAGAFGAHALRSQITPELLSAFETGVRYQMYHALALFGAAWMAGHGAIPEAAWASRFFILGTILFSGSLYGLALTNDHRLGVVTPIGGACFIVGWIVLAMGARKI